MKILSLDLSTKTGYSVLEDEELKDYGMIEKPIRNFDVNNYPNKEEEYPYNIIEAAEEMAEEIRGLCNKYKVDAVVIENTVKGRNRNTQRALEFFHFATIKVLSEYKVNYVDPSEWRSILNVRMSKDDRNHNAKVKRGTAKGKVTQKHLSVRLINEKYGMKFRLKDNDICDSICLGLAFLRQNS